jgi:DNA-binding MarR family transcriptional regulator
VVNTSPVPVDQSPVDQSPADPCSGVGDDFGWSLGVVFKAVLKAANEAASDVPGGQRGYHVLIAAADGKSGTQLALAQQLGVDKTVMTYLLDDLERAGLIERQPDPADRRARRVVITDAGHELRLTLQRRMREVTDQVLCGIEPAERIAVRSALHRAAGALADADPQDAAKACGA